MRKRLLHWTLAIVAAVLPAIPSLAQIPNGYYSSLKGKKGAELKTAIYNIIKDAKVLEYGKGKGYTWWGFWDTDRDERGYFIDRYSAEKEWVKSTSQGAVGAGMNIEHSFPKSCGEVPKVRHIKTSTTSCLVRAELIPQKAIILWVPL